MAADRENQIQSSWSGALARLGKAFRTRRVRAGLSQEEVAAALHVSRPLVGKVEGGKVPPSESFLRGYDAAFGIDEELQGLIEEAYATRPPRRSPHQVLERDLTINWLQRYEQYYRIWSSVAGIENDLTRALQLKREGDKNGYQEQLALALYHYASFLDRLERFIREFGGLWLLSDADEERAATNAVWLIGRLGPFGEREDSRLRMALRRLPDQEIEPFLDFFESNQAGKGLLATWRRWTAKCRCGADEPRASCDVHALMRACEEYQSIIDRSWYAHAPWYRKFPAIPYLDAATFHARIDSLAGKRAQDSP